MLTRQLYITLGLIAFAAFSLALPHAARAQSTCTPEQRKELILTAVDKEGRAIENLRAEHLSLKIGNAPATIADVTFHNRPPLDVAVLIDASISQEKMLPITQGAARAFVSSVLTPGQDRVAVVSFSGQPKYLQLLTSDFRTIGAAIDQIFVEIPPGYIGGGVVVSTAPPKTTQNAPGSTSLWDAVHTAMGRLFGDKAEKRRRAVLLFSDGVDTSSSGKLNAAIEDAINKDVAVFSIAIQAPPYEVDEGALKKLSEQTGGLARFPGKKEEKIEAALTDIAHQLRGNYVIGYCGGEPKSRAKVQVDVVNPEMQKAKPVLSYRRY